MQTVLSNFVEELPLAILFVKKKKKKLNTLSTFSRDTRKYTIRWENSKITLGLQGTR